MGSEFSARQASSHRKLIAFDKAVRTRVGGGQNQKRQISYVGSEITNVRTSKGRFSGSFGRDLFGHNPVQARGVSSLKSPEMHASPIHVVPKPHSEKLRMVTNQSAGPYAPNSMIKRDDSIKGFPLDNMSHLCWICIAPNLINHGSYSNQIGLGPSG
jgi:hypothetical protein